MLLQILAQGFAEDAHAAAVDDAYSRHAGQERAVDEFLDFAGGFVHSAADDVDFGGRGGVADFVLQLDGDATGIAPLRPAKLCDCVLAALDTTSAMSSRLIRIFMEPISTSK